MASECGDAEGGAGETWASHGTWHVRAGAKVGYSGRHGRTPRHIALTLGMGALAQIAVRKRRATGEGVGAWTMEGDGLRYGVCKV